MNIAVAGFESYELLLYPLGLGWLVLVFIPKRFIVPLLQIIVVLCAVLLPLQLLISDDIPKLAAFMVFQFLNGICAGCAFSLFCFKLNNVERLLGIAAIIFYYSLYYTIYRAFPAVQAVYKTWGGAVMMAIYLFIVFILSSKLKQKVFEDDEIIKETKPRRKDTKVGIVIGLHIVYYSIMCMINYIEGADNIIFSLPFGLGQFTSAVIIFIIMLVFNRNALYIWLMYLVFSLLGMSIVSYNTDTAYFTGSFFYGLGDGLGYIIIYYLCAGAIKKSKSIKIYRLFCLFIFIEYFFISGIFSVAMASYKGPIHAIALGVVLALCSFCFLILPYLQKKLFTADWTDGLHLKDMAEYTQGMAEAEIINIKENLNMTEREHEVLTMLFAGKPTKEISFTLKVSCDTVNFHIKNLYRKIGVQSRSELFAKYKNYKFL